MGRRSAILLRRREWTVNKENWPKTVQHNVTHQPRGRVPHKPTTHASKQQETTLNNNLSQSRHSDIQTSVTHTPVLRPRPCEADDLVTQATKVDSNEAKKKSGAAAPTSTPAPGPCTRLADEVDAERHGPKRADETPDLQRRRPQGPLRPRSKLGFSPEEPEAQTTRKVKGLLNDASMEWRCILGCHHRGNDRSRCKTFTRSSPNPKLSPPIRQTRRSRANPATRRHPPPPPLRETAPQHLTPRCR
jgi:hypothetical protein